MAEYTSVDYFSLDYILSPAVRNQCIEQFSNMPSYDPFTQENTFKQTAAVLIPICFDNGKVSILYTLRSAHLSSFGGQVSFPGGKVDQLDESLIETALRETEEELGISRSDIDVWGIGKCFVTLTKIAVYPVVGYIRNYKYENLRPNMAEVDKVFTLPIEHLCSRKNVNIELFGESKYLVPMYTGGPKKIWGLTAYITHTFLMFLFPDFIYSPDLTTYQDSSKL